MNGCDKLNLSVTVIAIGDNGTRPIFYHGFITVFVVTCLPTKLRCITFHYL